MPYTCISDTVPETRLHKITWYSDASESLQQNKSERRIRHKRTLSTYRRNHRRNDSPISNQIVIPRSRTLPHITVTTTCLSRSFQFVIKRKRTIMDYLFFTDSMMNHPWSTISNYLKDRESEAEHPLKKKLSERHYSRVGAWHHDFKTFGGALHTSSHQ